MGLSEIEKKIIAEVSAEADKIKTEAEKEISRQRKMHLGRMEEMKKELTAAALKKAGEVANSILVPARLGAKIMILEEKQAIMSKAYEGLKKEKALSDIEIQKIREESEVNASRILFG
jgi:vacuolar-type H+-ATPase subunit E/Vma4